MRIEIFDAKANGQTYYKFVLYDGPEATDEVRGFATDLIGAMTKILEWRERIARDYCEGESALQATPEE
jgi:hypothetical protein